jgi:bifunctional UDP-N-acetylglucosamine pyrophosphorylase/glucosamine-1-phosphate N-acetyltransferase
LNIIDPERFDIRGELTFKKNVSIDIGCILTGKIKLGNNVLVGAYSNLKNVEAGDNVEIKPYCHIENSKLKKGSSIGPFARLRDQTTIGQNCRVGNFVEIKNSFLGFGTKASHLSYLGDAKIGKNVNIGAGAITCNYDGINKNITTIDDNVFIGSNSSLVAPIKIKQGATIGASSCITEDAPAKSLNVERNKQTTIKNWKKK